MISSNSTRGEKVTFAAAVLGIPFSVVGVASLVVFFVYRKKFPISLLWPTQTVVYGTLSILFMLTQVIYHFIYHGETFGIPNYSIKCCLFLEPRIRLVNFMSILWRSCEFSLCFLVLWRGWLLFSKYSKASLYSGKEHRISSIKGTIYTESHSER